MITFYPEGTKVLPSDDSMRTLHKIAALAASGSTGGGGSGAQEVFLDLDPAAPTDPTKPALSINTTTQVMTVWNGSAWI